MGRKIPGKKHRGVKDPLKQNAQRSALLKKKINAPPTDPDDQPIPRSLQSLMLYKEKLKIGPSGVIKKKKKLKSVIDQNDRKSTNEIKNMKRNPGESGRGFMLRVNQAVHSISNIQGQMEDFKMGIDSDDEDDAPKNRKKSSEFGCLRKKKKKLDSDGQPKISRAKKWIMKKQIKKQQKSENKESSFAPKMDFVKFGEVAHEPPTLSVKPRKAEKQDGAPRPGRKDLLLNKLLGSQPNLQKPKNSKLNKVDLKSGSVNRSGKRKDLPFAERQRLEQSQQEAILAYRALKNTK